MTGVCFVLGTVVGIILRYVFAERKKPSGTFVMDFSDPDKEVCRLELDDNLNLIYSKKYIILRIKKVEPDSQE